jgi:CubicO group peptidase (beta-lactamase class C family)
MRKPRLTLPWKVMNKKILSTITTILLVACFSIEANLNEPENNKKLNEALSAIQASHNIPTLSVAVIEEGEFVYSASFGEVVDEAPKFRIASITKLFTAQAIMQLVELGIVQLDDPVSRYIEQFDGKPTTIEDLMSHGSGLRDTVSPVSPEEKRSFDEYLEQSLKGNAPSTNSVFEYADLNFNILGEILHVAMGIEYIDYVRANIIERLGLKDTYFYQHNASFDEPVSPHHNYGFVTDATQRPYDPSYAPSEGLISTATDLAAWTIAILSEHPALLSIESYRDMQTPRGKTTWGDLQIALGWQVLGHEIMQLAQHAGSMNGYKSLLITYPLKKRAVVVLGNAEEMPRWAIAQVVNQVIDGQPVTLPESSQARYRLTVLAAVLIIVGFIGFFIWRRIKPRH